MAAAASFSAFSELSSYSSSYKAAEAASGSACLYSTGYIIFVALFGVIMSQINAHNSCLDRSLLCEKVKKKLKRSGNEFMGYSICAFILITLSTVFTFYSAYLLKSSGSASISNFDW